MLTFSKMDQCRQLSSQIDSRNLPVQGLVINTPNDAGLHLRDPPESIFLSSRNYDSPAQNCYLGSVSGNRQKNEW